MQRESSALLWGVCRTFEFWRAAAWRDEEGVVGGRTRLKGHTFATDIGRGSVGWSGLLSGSIWEIIKLPLKTAPDESTRRRKTDEAES